MKSFFQNVVSREVINTKRQLEIDIVRGLAILFMLLVHVSGEFLDASENNTIFAKVIDFMGCVPAAPVFMFVMGVGFVFSKNKDPKRLFKRGLLILFLGYILNFFRGFLPLLIGSQLEYYPLKMNGLNWYHFLVEVDILQLAGIVMVFISLLKALKISEVFYPIIAVCAGIISPYLWGLKTGNTVVDVFIANIFGGTEYTFHPFLSWVFYPLMGSFFGWFLIRIKNKNKFYIFTSITSIMTTIIGIICYYMNPVIDFGIVTGDSYNYFHHGILSNIIFCSSVIWWLGIWYFMASVIPGFVKNRLLFWSNSVTIIYFVHWIIIGWCSFLVFDTFSLAQTIVAMIIFVCLTDRITDLYIKIKDRLSEENETNIPAVPN